MKQEREATVKCPHCNTENGTHYEDAITEWIYAGPWYCGKCKKRMIDSEGKLIKKS